MRLSAVGTCVIALYVGLFSCDYLSNLERQSWLELATMIALYVGLFSCDRWSVREIPSCRRNNLIALYVGLFSCDVP